VLAEPGHVLHGDGQDALQLLVRERKAPCDVALEEIVGAMAGGYA
jgi:hypothetical protein